MKSSVSVCMLGLKDIFCPEEERERCLHTSTSCLHVTLNLKETQSADLCSTELVEIF